MVAITLVGLTVFLAIRFIWANWGWLGPFFRDVRAWLTDPSVAGGWTGPAHPVIALPILLAVAALGWLAADLVLFDTALARQWQPRIGLTLLLGFAALGYAGMLAVSFGMLSRPFILALLVALAGILLLGRFIQRHSRKAREVHASVWRKPSLGSRGLRRGTAAVSALILTLLVVHSAMGPVQEWDASVYHAETARQWFERRPDPPLLFGPSVGIEISANYPPLFPAYGAALTTLVGHFDDLYLRLASPVLLLAIALVLFGYARERFDERTACFAVLFLLGTPLFLLYASWPTGYVLLAGLLLATAILVDLAARAGGRTRWAAAGAVAGLAILTSFYGAVALICGLAAAFLYRRPRLFNTLLFMVAALAVAAPWLVRNFVLLGDPIYPLGTPPFDGKGIVEPLWTASKEEISRNALGYWAGSHGLWLRLRELTSALFDRQMLATGLYFGLLLGLTFRRREPVMAYLALVLLGLLVVVLVPGWFWLRSLVPAIPIAALLTGRVLSDLLAPKTEIPKERRFAESGLRTAAVLSVTAVLVASGLVGISLAVAGPNQYTWTTGLSEQDDLMRGVKNLGSPREQLWSTFTGDLLMWEWINHNVRPGERIGTLEFRTYYLDRPEDLFYLDGIEAVPLLKMSTPEQVSRFFNDQGVRYVALPSWSMHGPSSHPVKDLLPLFRMLGGAFFPTVATFAIGGSDTPSVVYSVGSTDKEPVIGVFPGSIGSSMTLEATSVTISPRRDDPRIFVPVSHERAEAVFLEYETEGTGRFDMNLFEPSTSSWREGVFVGERTGYPGVAQAILPLPPSNQAFFNLGFYVTGDPLRLRELRLVEPVTPLVRTAAGASIEDVDAQFELPAGDTEIRVFVPVGASGRAQLHISYFDGAGGSFDINQYNSDSREWTGLRSIPRRNTEKWKSFVLSIRSRRPGFVELGVFVRERPLQIQELTVD